MGYLFGHYTGKPELSETAIATLQEFDTFFRSHKPADYGRMPLLGQLLSLKRRLYEGLPQKDYRFTIRDSRNLSQVYVYSGMRSSVNWAESMTRQQLVFDNITAVAADQLYFNNRPAKSAKSLTVYG